MTSVAFLGRMFFASFELAATILIVAPLYLCGALYFAACIFLGQLRGLFERAIAIWCVRVAPTSQSVNANETSPTATCGPVGRGRFESWLN